MGEPLPLFPLNTVLFPGVVLPLHIFEARYRRLVRDLMALPPNRDRELGVVALKVGSEVDNGEPTAIQRVGCAALLTAAAANDDGSYEIVVVGRRRFEVFDLDHSQAYLQAEVGWLSDLGDPDDGATPSVVESARRLFDLYRDRVRALRTEDVLEGPTPEDPVDLSYTIAAATVLPLEERQQLLECRDVTSRLRLGTALLADELRAISAVPSLPASSPAASWALN